MMRTTSIGIVLGCPRSGTTFLMKCLSAMTNSECMSGHLIPIYVPHLVNQSLDKDVYQTMSNGVRFSFAEYIDSVVDSRVSNFRKLASGDIGIFEFVEFIRKGRKVENFIYKEPFLSFSPKWVYDSLPDAKIIYIYRDGRDSADSLQRKYRVLTDSRLEQLTTAELTIGRKVDDRYVPWWVEVGREDEFLMATPFVRAVWMWNEMNLRCINFFTQPEVKASGRVLFLRYEDLVTQPEKYGELVVHHLGGVMNNRLKKKFAKAKVDSCGIYKRREESEIRDANKVGHDALEFHGYI